MTSEQDAARVVQTALERFGRLDILVNNAGRGMKYVSDHFMTEPTRFWEVAPATWRLVIDTNVNGPFLMARAAVPQFLRAGWGRIVNVSMNHATMRRAGFSPYGPSKAALESETVIWAADLAGTGVTVNALLPGGATLTGMIPDELSSRCTRETARSRRNGAAAALARVCGGRRRDRPPLRRDAVARRQLRWPLPKTPAGRARTEWPTPTTTSSSPATARRAWPPHRCSRGAATASASSSAGPASMACPAWPRSTANSARIIQAAADIDQALRNSEPRRRYILANGDGEILIDMNWDTPDVSGFPHRISLHQPDIEDAMDAAARARGAEINQGWEVVALAQDNARVTVTARERIVRDGAEPAWGRERRVTARYVIGADGARSAVREALGIERESWPFRAAWLSCDMTRKRPLPNFWSLSPDARIAVDFLRACRPRPFHHPARPRDPAPQFPGRSRRAARRRADPRRRLSLFAGRLRPDRR